jgi:hypothetical protein
VPIGVWGPLVLQFSIEKEQKSSTPPVTDYRPQRTDDGRQRTDCREQMTVDISTWFCNIKMVGGSSAKH